MDIETKRMKDGKPLKRKIKEDEGENENKKPAEMRKVQEDI